MRKTSVYVLCYVSISRGMHTREDVLNSVIKGLRTDGSKSICRLFEYGTKIVELEWKSSNQENLA
jgi:hypothetical protein